MLLPQGWSWALLLAAGFLGPAASTNFDMVKFSGPGAACLDGTEPAFYSRANASSPNFYLFFEGGGWCTSLDDCLSRSRSDLGSSAAYPATMNDESDYFSSDPALNPTMWSWNMIYVKYCDGGSWTGSNDTATVHQGSDLFFRGQRNFEALLATLVADFGLAQATEVVVGGCSAGALTAFLHVDQVATLLPNARVVGMPDSGFFLDFEDTPGYQSSMHWVFEQMNSSAGTDPECLAAFEDSPANCIFAEHAAPFIDAPIFPLQSEYDSWQLSNILDPSASDDEVNAYGAELTSRFEAAVLAKPQNGVFLDSCYHHCGNWNSMLVGSNTPATAFTKWYTGEVTDTDAYFAQAQPYPCDACCSAAAT